jgi:hypothetical protein
MKETHVPGNRLIGVLVGLGLALTYGSISATINLIVLNDVPMYFDVGKVGASILWMMLGGAVLGYVVGWPFSSLAGVALGAFSGTVLIFIMTFSGALDRSGAIPLGMIMAFYGFFPLTVIMFPVMILLRWGISSLRRSFEETNFPKRLRTIAILFILSALVGMTSMLTGEQRNLVRRMDRYVQTAQGRDSQPLPAMFEPIVSTIRSADPIYTLEWTDNLDRFPIPVILEDAFMAARMEIVFAHFDNGVSVACLFRVRDAAPQTCLPAEINP